MEKYGKFLLKKDDRLKSVRLVMSSFLSTGENFQGPPSPIGKLVTPRAPSKTSSDTFLQSPETPLFSKEDQIQIHKQKEKLELDIASLEQKRNSLLAEVKRVKENKVSQCELLHLKAETSQKVTETYASKVADLMTNYAEIVKENKAKQSSIEMYELKIADEIAKRPSILNEITQRQTALDLSDIKYKIPEIQKQSVDSQRTHLDIETLLQLSHSTNKENNELVLAKPAQNIMSEAASEYAKSIESQWKLYLYGSTGLRAQISDLQRRVSESDLLLKKMENETIEEKRRKEQKLNDMSKQESEISSHNQVTVDSFHSQITQMDNEIEKLKNSIEDSAKIYENIQQEMDEISDKHRAILDLSFNNSQNDSHSYTTHTETYDSVSDDFRDGEYENSSIKQRSVNSNAETKNLLEKKAKLQEEVMRMRDKYRLMKTNAILRKEKKMSEITRLYNRYKASKAKLGGNESIEMIVLDDDNTSKFSKHISKIISKIDSSIIELKQDLE